jgi:uncharacterized damage-inducible protein DinB
MSESEHLSQGLDCFFGDPHNGWFTPITAAIAGLSANQAAFVPAPRFNSVWAVVNHIWLCNKMTLLRLQNQPVDHNALGTEDDWPRVTDPEDEIAWQAACQRMIAVNQELAQTIAEFSAEDLYQGLPEHWKSIQGVLAHNSYHTCEIISIRHLQRLWVEEV